MTAELTAERRGSYFYFDCMRFFAALLVIIEHGRDMLWLNWSELHAPSLVLRPVYFLSGFGAVAVTVFFVLSGYWVSSSIYKRMDNARFWQDYLIDRCSRLWIVIIPCLLIGGLCDLAGRYGLNGVLYSGHSGALTQPVDVATKLDAVSAIGNVLFLQTVFVKTFGSNGSLWSLANEFWYYIWFPVLVFLAVKRRFSWAMLSIIVVIAAPHLLPGFVTWLLGAGLCYADRKVQAGSGRFPAWSLPAASIVFVLVAALARFNKFPAEIQDNIVGLFFAGWAWVLLRRDPRPLAWFKPVARYGAEASFSLYALHMPLLALLMTLRFPAGRQVPNGANAVWGLCYLLLTIALAYGFAYLTERNTGRFRALLRRHSARFLARGAHADCSA